MKNFFQKFSGMIGVFALLSISLFAQIDPGQFSTDAVTQKLIASLHHQADFHNSEAVRGYNLAVSNYNLNAPIRASLHLPVLPKPDPPMLEFVDEAVITAMEHGEIDGVTAQIFTFKQYVPPTPVLKPVLPPVKALAGAYQGNGVWGCLPGDKSPDGTKGKDARGSFLKHLQVTAFGASCSWEMIP